MYHDIGEHDSDIQNTNLGISRTCLKIKHTVAITRDEDILQLSSYTTFRK